jgi:hypothetical protein
MTCVPACNATHHGYELLATIDGADTQFSCSLANLLYYWIGAAALGGFLGENVAAFVSAVISGAAGIYVLMLMEDADCVGTDLVVQPWQNVIISGASASHFSFYDSKVDVNEGGRFLGTNISLTSLLLHPRSTTNMTQTQLGYIDFGSRTSDAVVSLVLIDTIIDGTGECQFRECTVQTGNLMYGARSNQISNANMTLTRTIVSPQVLLERTVQTQSPISAVTLGVGIYGGDSYVDCSSSVFERVHILANAEMV